MPSENDGPSELPDFGLAATSLSAGSPTCRITVRRPRVLLVQPLRARLRPSPYSPWRFASVAASIFAILAASRFASLAASRSTLRAVSRSAFSAASRCARSAASIFAFSAASRFACLAASRSAFRAASRSAFSAALRFARSMASSLAFSAASRFACCAASRRAFSATLLLARLRLRDPWPLAWPFQQARRASGALLFASLSAAPQATSRFAFFAAASSFATSCLAASASERRCSAAPFELRCGGFVLGGEVGCFRCSSLQRRGGKPCSLGCGFATRGLSPGLFSKRVELCSPAVCLLDRNRTLSGIALCLLCSGRELRHLLPCRICVRTTLLRGAFDSAAGGRLCAWRRVVGCFLVAAASSAGMPTATLPAALGGAARLPFLDFLIFNLAFDFALYFAFFGMAGHV